MAMQNTGSQHQHSQAVGVSGEAVPEWLGDKLKAMFSDVMTEPVPEDLVALLLQLEKRDREKR